MFEIITTIAVIIFLVFNLSASKACIKDDSLTKSQTSLQFALIWLLPIVGSLLVLYFITDSHTPEEVKDMTIGPFYIREFSKTKKASDTGHGHCGSSSIDEGCCGSD